MTVKEALEVLTNIENEGLSNMELKYQTYNGEVLDVEDVTVGSYCIKLSE